MRIRGTTGAMLIVAVLPSIAGAQSEDLPPLDFFEYLGSWQEEDEEWFIDAEIDGTAPEDDPDARRKRERAEDDE